MTAEQNKVLIYIFFFIKLIFCGVLDFWEFMLLLAMVAKDLVKLVQQGNLEILVSIIHVLFLQAFELIED